MCYNKAKINFLEDCYMNNIIRKFSIFLDNKNVRYNIAPNDSNIIRIQNQLEKNSSAILTIILACDDDEAQDVHMIAFGIGQSNNIDEKLLNKLNELNHLYRWFKFYVEPDGKIIMSYDFYVRENSNEHLFELLLRVLTIADDSYPQIMQCLWG